MKLCESLNTLQVVLLQLQLVRGHFPTDAIRKITAKTFSISDQSREWRELAGGSRVVGGTFKQILRVASNVQLIICK